MAAQSAGNRTGNADAGRRPDPQRGGGHRRIPLSALIRTGVSPALDRAWIIAAVILIAAAVALVVTAPADAVQGGIQKLMYLHVPSAWNAFLCFAAVLVSSIWFLCTRSERAWRIGGITGAAGVVLIGCTLIAGSTWGSVTWGTWWAWDARITSATALGLAYVVYLSLRALATSPRARTVSAGVGICSFALAPVVHFSVVWFRTLHQQATVLAPSLAPPIDTQMLIALAAAVAAVSVTCTLVMRWVLARREDHPEPPSPAAEDSAPLPDAVVRS